jgi:Domain of unknown function (DUF4350)
VTASPRSGPWTRLSAPARAAVSVGGALLLLEATVASVNLAAGGGGASGPPSSAYATQPLGLAAYADLLARHGHHEVVRQRRPLNEVRLPARATVVLLDPRRVAEAEADALRLFVERGGRLIAGGRAPSWLDRVLEGVPEWAPERVERAAPVARAPETEGIEEVTAVGRGSWTDNGAAMPILRGPPGALASVMSVGAGRVVLLADTSPLQNRALGRADNAAFGLQAAGGRARTVHFGEAAHGFGEATGLRALPLRWRFALGGLGVAAALWLWAAARRMGPPESDGRPSAPARRLYADALATALARSGRPEEAMAPVKGEVRARLAERAGGPETGVEGLRRAAGQLGMTDEETDALFRPAESDADVLALGRALARTARTPAEASGPGGSSFAGALGRGDPALTAPSRPTG